MFFPLIRLPHVSTMVVMGAYTAHGARVMLAVENIQRDAAQSGKHFRPTPRGRAFDCLHVVFHGCGYLEVFDQVGVFPPPSPCFGLRG